MRFLNLLIRHSRLKLSDLTINGITIPCLFIKSEKRKFTMHLNFIKKCPFFNFLTYSLTKARSAADHQQLNFSWESMKVTHGYSVC